MRINYSILLLRFMEIVLGGLFIYAGVQKLLYPYDFAEAVIAYEMLPLSLVGVIVAVLPWIEVASGLCLAVGLKRRSCLLILSGLLTVFLVIILATLARGLKIDCGCGLFFQRQVGLIAIVEDLLLLAWALSLYYWELINEGFNFLGLAPKTQN